MTMAVAGMGTANASPAIALVSTNPVNYTPNINQGAVFKMAEANGMLYAGGSFTHGHRGRRDHAAGHIHPEQVRRLQRGEREHLHVRAGLQR